MEEIYGNIAPRRIAKPSCQDFYWVTFLLARHFTKQKDPATETIAENKVLPWKWLVFFETNPTSISPSCLNFSKNIPRKA